MEDKIIMLYIATTSFKKGRIDWNWIVIRTGPGRFDNTRKASRGTSNPDARRPNDLCRNM